MKNVSPTARKLARNLFRRNGLNQKPVALWDLWDVEYVLAAISGAQEYALGSGKPWDSHYFHKLWIRVMRSRRLGNERRMKEAA